MVLDIAAPAQLAELISDLLSSPEQDRLGRSVVTCRFAACVDAGRSLVLRQLRRRGDPSTCPMLGAWLASPAISPER